MFGNCSDIFVSSGLFPAGEKELLNEFAD